MSAYGVISTRFGSISTIRSSFGEKCISRPVMIAFRHTDLPAPVAPAISRWGIFARSASTGLAGHPGAEGDRQVRLRRELLVRRPRQQLLHRHHRRGAVRHLDAHDRLPGHGRLDAQRRRRERQCEVVLQRGDAVHADARARDLDLLHHRLALVVVDGPIDVALLHRARAHVPARLHAELRHRRPLVDLDDARVHPERRERVHDQLPRGAACRPASAC